MKGVRPMTRLRLKKSSCRDPFTGEKRQWSGFTDTVVELGLRHDIPASDWAWGGDFEYSHYQPNYRRNQTDKVWAGPFWASLLVENKDVFGLPAPPQISPMVNARSTPDHHLSTRARQRVAQGPRVSTRLALGGRRPI